MIATVLGTHEPKRLSDVEHALNQKCGDSVWHMTKHRFMEVVEAIDAVADLLPNNFDPDRAKAWKATVKLKPPTGVEVTGCRAYHFEQASGSDKARKIA
jgi:hypothetical protein